jgi:cation diffusion facilitator CzcD-associated flavoprotein CzcO
MTTTTEPQTERETVDVAIVGSGFSGLGAAIQLKRQGRDDFVVLERAEEVGGTWWANTYPGCGCDVPSHLYSFSFAPNPNWSETYSQQPEIRDYLIDCSRKFGVRDHVRFNHELTDARWDADAQRWDIETTGGSFRARVLILAAGALFEPRIPDLPGIGSFEGETWHSARWNHDYDLKGKRVASIGTGASAIQLVPSIQPEVEQLYVVQRTPPWVFPHSTRPTTRFERRLYKRFPALQKLVRGSVYAARETFVLGFVKQPKIMKIAEKISRAHMRKEIDDPELLEKVTPDYTIGCKRILPSNKWYPALAQDNVELVTSGIREFKPNAIVFEDGTEREIDAVIFSTGFQVTEMPSSNLVRNAEGSTLRECWESNGGPQAHLGTAINGFPNMFLMLGPNTGLGHSSMVYMAESQINYMLDALRAMDERGAAAVEVRRDAEDAYNRDLHEKLQGTVWNTGCSSWYVDQHGRNVTLWPDWTFRFRQRTARFDPESYELAAPAREREDVAA